MCFCQESDVSRSMSPEINRPGHWAGKDGLQLSLLHLWNPSFFCVSFAVFTQYLYHSSRWPYVSPMNAIGCLFWRRRPSCVCSGGEEGGEGVNWRLRVRFLRNEFLLRLWCPSYKHSSHISANYWHSLHTHTHMHTHTHTPLFLLLYCFSSFLLFELPEALMHKQNQHYSSSNNVVRRCECGQKTHFSRQRGRSTIIQLTRC